MHDLITCTSFTSKIDLPFLLCGGVLLHCTLAPPLALGPELNG